MKAGTEWKAGGWAVLAAAATWAASWSAAGQIAAANIGRLDPIPALAGDPGQMIPSIATPEIIDRGRFYFGQSCSHCHADDASGDEGPDLHRLSLSDARIAVTIRKGIKGEMPAFEKKYSQEDVKALIGYLRSLK